MDIEIKKQLVEFMREVIGDTKVGEALTKVFEVGFVNLNGVISDELIRVYLQVVPPRIAIKELIEGKYSEYLSNNPDLRDVAVKYNLVDEFDQVVGG